MIKMKFEILKNTLQDSIFTWDYFTDFEKVKKNIKKIEKELNLLNYLIGKENLEEEFLSLVEEYPKVRKILPILIAIRNNKLSETSVITDEELLNAENKKYIFNDPIDENIKKELLIFFNISGLKYLFESKSVKNLVDYCYGVEVGLDTNARKNRTGKLMEELCENFMNNFIKEHKEFKLLREATKVHILKEFNIDVKTQIDADEKKKNDRRFDFVLYDTKKHKLYIFEVNYYSSSGSKPNSIAREYTDLFVLLKSQNIEFVWITDGKGWLKMTNALEQTVEHNDYVINLDMLKNGILEEIVLSKSY
ncbi:type II restriction endonuclease [Sulfurimonas sp.]|uniref:type II restriction endonuclease n=1 Tax=Sulfurimonas sp. TaxID=2022749 RepID=UPI002601E206|nr:type II restriction endonuclease [Sulfurimonas sp.]